MSYYFGTEYLTGQQLKAVISKARKKLRDSKMKFDTIAVQGHSGMLIGPALAMALNKKLMIIRKPNESSHSSYNIEGWGQNQKILLVDDFISSGATMRRMIKSINDNCDSPTISGILLYASSKRDKKVLKLTLGDDFEVCSIPRF